MSPRQAMEVALESEIKAHHFFEQALKSVQNVDVKALFEELCTEEVHHQQLVQQQLAKLPADSGGPDKSDEDLDEPPAL